MSGTEAGDEYKDGPKDTIEVRGPENLINRYKLDLLQLYFESQGDINGSITDISFDAVNAVVVIKFDSEQVAQKIECKSHVLKGENLNIKLRQSTDIDSRSAQTTHAASIVRVSGLKRIETKEIVEYYFENRRRSGGGPIKSFVPVESDGDIYDITFENTKDAQSVIERRHVINGLSVDVTLLHNDSETEYYDDRFLIKGLHENTSDECIVCFIKAETGMKPKFLAFHKKEKDVVLVIMRCDLDIAQLIEHCKEETLEGAKIQIYEVEMSNVIHVSNLPENIHSDTILLYFENKRKSKGGMVINVIRLEKASCLVYFKDYKVTEGVLDHVHVLQRRDLTVRKYFKCVAQTEEEAFSTNIPHAVVIPDLDIRILKFIQQNEKFKQLVHQELLSHHAQVDWPKEGSDSCEVSINCIVDTSNVLSNRVNLRWGEEIGEVFKCLMDKIYVHCITLIGEFNLDDSCIDCTAGNEENILVLLDRGKCRITFVGTSPKLASTLRSQDNFSEDAEEELKVEAIEVSKFQPPPPVSSCTVEVTGPCSVVSEDHLEILEMYFESTKRSGGGEVVDTKFDTVNNIVLVTFDSEEVAQRFVDKGNHVIKNEKLNVMMHIPSQKTIKNNDIEEKRKTTYTIKVKGINKSAPRDTVKFYFENSRRSGGGEIETIKSDDEDEDVLYITFKSTEVAKRICDKQGHEVNGKPLWVSPYYECEGKTIWGSGIHVLKIPEPLDVQHKPNYLCILNRSCCAQLHNDLRKNNCSMEFKDKVLQLHCTLTPEMTEFKGLAENWEESSRSIIDQYISENMIEKTLKSSEQVWNELIEFLHAENVLACEEVAARIDSIAFTIILAGFSGQVEDKLRQLKEKHTEIEKRLSRRTETIDHLDDMKLKLLEKVGVFEHLRDELGDIKIDIGDGELTIEGQPGDITLVRIKWYDMDNRISHKQWNHGFSKECVFFVNNVLTGKIQSLLEGNNIIAVWKMDAKVLSLYTYDVHETEDVFGEGKINSQVCTKAEELLKSAVIEIKEPIEHSIIAVLNSPEWYLFGVYITKTYENSAELETKDSEILIRGMKIETHEVHTYVKDFLDKNVILSDTLKTGTMNIRFSKMHRQDFVSSLEHQHKVKIELKDASVSIRGNKSGIFEAKKMLKTFFDRIICDKHTIQRVAVKNVFKDENEHGTIKKIEQETSCLIKLPGENAPFVETADIADEFEDSDEYMSPHFSKEATVPHVSRETTGSNQYVFGPAASDVSSPREQGFKAQNGVKVYLVKRELGKQDGNVIVVTTSPNLNLNNGDDVCKSVLREGGQQLQNECKEKYPNEIKFGEIAVVHGHGTLDCNYVYLTTLPNWNSEHNPEQVMEKVMKGSLELAEKHKKYSIVFCAMGTGQLQYPTDLVAKIMYQAVIDFDKCHPQSSLKEVKFVLYQKDVATIKAFEEEEHFRLVGGVGRPTFELKTGNITIELLVENIAQQEVDAILLSTSPYMDFNRSVAWEALVRVGGKTLQDECKSKYGNTLEEGNVVEIGVGNLPCKSVFLTVLPRFNDDAINILTKMITAMLNLANAKGYKSLALPALGTGFLHYSTNEVCQCMFQTVIYWAKKNAASSIINIRFIMSARDQDVIQKFKSYILNEKDNGQRRSSTDLKQQGSHPKKVFQSHIPKKDEKALYAANADGVQIGKIKLNVFKDDILSQKTDVIVSSVGKGCEFNGAIAKILKGKCPDIEQECQKKENIAKLSLDGVVMTKGYQLHAKYVIHVKFAEHIDDWKTRMLKCVEKANKKRLKTIAFPVLGTGKGFKTFSSDAIAGFCLMPSVSLYRKLKVHQ